MTRVFLIVCSVWLGLNLFGPCWGQESKMNRLTCPSVSELKQVFRDGPGKGHGPAEIVFWNERQSKELIDHLLDELTTQHIREFFFYPTFGLDVAYLSEDFFTYYKYTLSEAKKRGMDVWLYDEYSWPSGFAGGLLGEALPDAAAKGLYFSDVKKLDALPEHLLAVFERLKDGTLRDITSQTQASGKLAPGQYKLAFLKYSPREQRLADGVYCDMLKKGVTEKFIELTHKAYQKHSGNEFGRTVRGIFTDEMTLGRAGGVSWTDDLPSSFQKKFGYSIWSVLPLLHQEKELLLPDGRAVDAAEVRHHHKSVLLDLDVERWCKPIFNYCEENLLEFCGHYQEHWWAYSSTNPDVAAMYVWQQRPTIDIIFNQWSQKHRGQAGNIRIVRELGSLANQLGRAKTFAETCGAAGWGLLPLDIKRLTDWETVLGVTNMAEMGPQLSVRGGRKFDEGPSIYYHMPWWEEYHRLVDYETRLSWLSSQGKQNNDLLILQPTTSLWLHSNDHKICEPMAQAFCDMLIKFEERQLEYDLGSEYVLDLLGSVTDAKLIVGKADYSTVLIPENFENIERTTLVLLDKFVRKGGSVVVLGDLPKRIDGRKWELCDHAVKQLYAKLFAPELVKKEFQFSSEDFPVKLLPGVWQTNMKKFLDVPWNRSSYALAKRPVSTDKSFLQMYKNGQIADTPWLYHLRREVKDGEFLFFVNSDREKTRTFSFFTSPQGEPSRVWSKIESLDLATGNVTPFACNGAEHNGRFVTRLDVTLEPCGSLALVLTAGTNVAEKVVETRFDETVIKPLTMPEVKRLSPNVHVLDFCSLKAGDKQFDEDYFFRIDQQLWRHYGFRDNPWWHLPQRQQDIVNRKFEKGKGFEATYRFVMDDSCFAKKKNSPLYAVIELPEQYTIRCNGKVVRPVNQWWFDRSAIKVDITDAVKPGQNELTLTLDTMNVWCDIVSLYLLGDFDLKPVESGFVMTAPSNIVFRDNDVPSDRYWSNRGMPFYGEKVSYREQFRLSIDSEAKYYVQLPRVGNLGLEPWAQWNAALAQIFVNGTYAGIIFCEPCRLDITPWLKDGINTIDAVLVGSPRNWCGPHYAGQYYNERGYYNDFKKAPVKRPPGEKYDVIPYGLTEPFLVIQHATNEED